MAPKEITRDLTRGRQEVRDRKFYDARREEEEEEGDGGGGEESEIPKKLHYWF